MSSDSREFALCAHGLGKRYLIYDQPHHRLLQSVLRRPMHREFWALRGVDFEVARGEAVGIIGRNGSGKSTLLQVLCGILPPTEGIVQVGGRIAALLELGAGFNPEFTGRENIYLKASLLGLSRARVDAVIGDILAFAEIGDHVDQPIKTYSSGMFVRLAFAVAVHCDPDILVVDEALAVGDVYFQAKCQRRIEQLRRGGCTLLFVTHSVDALAKLCDRVVVMNAGRKVFDGDVRAGVAEYLRLVFGSATVTAPVDDAGAATAAAGSPSAEGTGDVDDVRAWLRARSGDSFAEQPGYHRGEVRVGTGGAAVEEFAFDRQVGRVPAFDAGERARLCVRYRLREASSRLVFGLQIHSADDVLVYSTNTFYQSGETLDLPPGIVIGEFDFDTRLLPGLYFITVGVSRFDANGVEIEAMDRRMKAIVMTVIGITGRALGYAELDATLHVGSLEVNT
ncbi:MAG TPA: ABC transporter ATP-binding protein [Lysobacter sp.]|nr:ABC transporter ATP-binding protein [Lysobacter sp.]